MAAAILGSCHAATQQKSHPRRIGMPRTLAKISQELLEVIAREETERIVARAENGFGTFAMLQRFALLLDRAANFRDKRLQCGIGACNSQVALASILHTLGHRHPAALFLNQRAHCGRRRDFSYPSTTLQEAFRVKLQLAQLPVPVLFAR